MMLFTSCGFHPLQGRDYKASLAVDLSSLDISAKGSATQSAASTTSLSLDRRYTEMFMAEVRDQINPEGERHEKLFHVAITFNELDVALFVNPDGTASRGDLIYTSNYAVTRKRDGKVVTTGTITRTSSYNTSPTADYASFVSIEDARKRGVLELAQDYKLRLATLLPTLNQPIVAPPKKDETPIPALQPNAHNEDRPPGY